jgi:protein-S-isoprenylcysteine O-methyltransferase Ste14
VISLHQAKLALALAGLLVFFTGAKLGLGWLRWAGIALVAAAWLLRFYTGRAIGPTAPTSSENQ